MNSKNFAVIAFLTIGNLAAADTITVSASPPTHRVNGDLITGDISYILSLDNFPATEYNELPQTIQANPGQTVKLAVKEVDGNTIAVSEPATAIIPALPGKPKNMTLELHFIFNVVEPAQE